MLSNDVQIGTQILHQLGGNMFSLLTGSKAFVAIENGLQFRVGRNPKNVSHVKITLTGNDDYTVEYMQVRVKKSAFTVKTLLIQQGVTDETLQASFTEGTGLFTKL